MMRDADGNHVSLRDYIDRIFIERDRADVKALESERERLIAEREQLRLARENLNAELAKLNNLRTEVVIDRGAMVEKTTYSADNRALHAKIDTAVGEIKGWQDRADGGLNVARFLGAGGVAALVLELARAAGIVK